ncbi:GNAT family N-acetyltransferase [Alkalilimnicola sp. S0819]|uniref:GNAT family N-acetyltransferase n=1 Tax=Alkalilimnicola sp. S0819 TaxID=2613922 RepID=UPI0012620FB8|nr:GNAT family N-acetyltransferase [Alkalilimnicola sp. S0819]KAB7619536.1 GNAT family N-acetyltransferase [Alkalilimnicola sp. S0819]MPQ17643.1 GNAT family N-acetyltransferase [Alkalilimnicola sp. S0819]
MPAQVAVSVHGPNQVPDGGLTEQWERLLAQSTRSESLFQSRSWLDQLPAPEKGPPWELFTLHDPRGELLALAPVRRGRQRLRFHVSARTLAEIRLPAVNLQGSEPLLAEGQPPLEALVDALWRHYPRAQCLYLDSVTVNGDVWRQLQRLHAAGWALVYAPDGPRAHHMLDLPTAFPAYLRAQFSAKTRNTLRRKQRQLAAAGELRLWRVEKASEVADFLARAAEVSRQSWQHRRLGPRVHQTAAEQRRLCGLAERGLLRSYLLFCGHQPCAFVLGYQYRGVFHYSEVAFDARYGRRRLSPSLVLLYRLIEDLTVHRPARCLDFGVGDADYKRLFANRCHTDATVLVLRRSWRNRLLLAAHRGFRGAIRTLKGGLGGVRPSRPSLPAPAVGRGGAHGG